MKKTLTAVIAVLIALHSLGQSISINPSNLQLPRVSALPSCLAADYGEMVFLTTNNKAHVCNSTGWVAIEASTGGGLNLPINATSDLAGSQLIYVSNPNGGANSIGMSGTANTNNGGIGVSGTASANSPTNNSVGVYGANVSMVTSALRGIGVYGKHDGAGWGVYGQVTEGFAVEGSTLATLPNLSSILGAATTGNGILGVVSGAGVAGKFSALNGGTAGRFEATGVNSRAIVTAGAVKLTGIGEGAGKLLKADNLGNASWVNATKSDILTIPASAFMTNISQNLLFNGSSVLSFLILANGTDGTLYAPVLLPNGATITSFRLVYLDNSNSHAITSCVLQTNSQTSTGFTAISSLTIPTTTSTNLQSVNSTALSSVVNNDTNFYRVLVTMNATPLIGISAIEIKYTYQVNQ